MLTKFIQDSYQKWVSSNPLNLSMEDFIDYAANEHKMDPNDVRNVLNGKRGGISYDTKLNAFIENSIESKLKDYYTQWSLAPVEHTHKNFIGVCTQEFNIEEKDLLSRLVSYTWYKSL